ncbi:uncharacterized protein LOC113168528 [Anabas testudineus]|uniref:uncharacterized protein LOC113168528 n=1 Tax=Anabas testudineus TaxID=64144 RepID=UPI000E4608B7|nr:uncharacterized protein LOC113168528 [Anabas testudineus]
MSDWTIGLLLLLTVSIIYSSVGQHQVIGATEPIVAAQGDDVIVPCYIDPPLNVEELTVDWWRPDVPPDPTDPPDKYRYVHRYHDKNNVEDMKMSSYSGRTAIFKDELRKGNVSLKIVNVKLSDQGRYRCAVPQLGSATVMRLIVVKKHDESRITEIPKLTGGFTTSVSIQTRVIIVGLGEVSLSIAVWVIIILCCGLSGYLLKRSRNYLPKYTPEGEAEGRVFLPLKPV